MPAEGGMPVVDGKALVRDYLREVFSEGRLDRIP